MKTAAWAAAVAPFPGNASAILRLEREQAAGADADAAGDQTPRRRVVHDTPVSVQIDFDGLRQRIISVPGIARAAVFVIASGADGIVYLPRSRPRAQPEAAVAAAEVALQ